MVTRAEALRKRTRQQLARQRIPRPTPISPEQKQIQQQIETAQAEKEARLKEFDVEIQSKQTRLNTLLSRIAEEERTTGRSPPARGGLKTELENVSNQLRELQNLRKREDVSLSQAIQIAGQRAERGSLLSALQLGGAELQRELIQEGIDVQKLKSGEIEFRDLSPRQLEVLQKKSLVEVGPTITTIDLPASRLEPPEVGRPTQLGRLKDVLFGETGKELIRIPLTAGLPGGTSIKVSELNEILQELGLAGGVASKFIPETPGEAILFQTVGALASGTGIVAKLTKGTLTTTGTLTALNPDLPAEDRIAGGIIAVAPLLPKINKISNRLVEEALTGKSSRKLSVQFSVLEQFFRKQKKTKSELQQALDEFSIALNLRKEGNVVRSTTTSEKLSLINKALIKIRNEKNPVLRREKLEGFVEFVKRDLGEKKAKALFMEFISQEGVILKNKPLIAKLKIEIPKPITVIDISRSLTQGKIVPKGLKPSVLIKDQRVKFQRLKNDLRIQHSFEKNKLRKLIANRADQKLIELQRTRVKQVLRELTRTLQKPLLRVLTKQQQKLKTKQQQKLKQLQKQIQKQRQRFKEPRIITRAKQLGKLKPFSKLKKPAFGEKKKKKGIKKKVKRIKKPFSVFVRKQGIDFKVKSFKSKPKARKFLRRKLSDSLRASGFITKNNRKIKPLVKKGFRLSKTRKNVLVERKEKRLDSKQEVRSIQKARKMKRLPKPKFNRV